MSTEPSDTPQQVADRPLVLIVRLLGSLRFALGIVVLIAAACVAGTLFPQGAQVADFLQQNPAAMERMKLLGALGLTNVFFSWWFVALLCLLSASLMVCTYRRYEALRRAGPTARVRVLGSLVTHISLLIILAGAVIRAQWGEKGFIEFREGDTVAQFMGQTGPASLPFAVRLVDFNIEYYEKAAATNAAQPGTEPDRLVALWPDRGVTNVFPVASNAEYDVAAPASGAVTALVCRLAIKRYVPDFMIDGETKEVKSRSDRPNNPAILVTLTTGGQTEERWLFARFPDFNAHGGEGGGAGAKLHLRYESMAPMSAAQPAGRVKDFKSHLQIIVGDQVVQEKTIEVNAPMSHGGYTFYQSGYDPRDMTRSTLQVVRDPGVYVVYTGFALMMVGLSIVFWLAPSMESARRKAGVAS